MTQGATVTATVKNDQNNSKQEENEDEQKAAKMFITRGGMEVF